MEHIQEKTETQGFEDSSPSGDWNSPALHMLLLFVLAVAVYANTFQVPFYFDDDIFIINNPVIHSLSGFLGGGGFGSNPRYISYLTFAINYAFGGLNVVGYHLVNLAIHIGNSLLVYFFVRLLVRTPSLKGINSRGLVFIPLATAVLFTIHPMQTQAVTYISQRMASLVTFFYLASVVSHLNWRLSREEGAPFSSGRVLFYWTVSLCTAVLAMKTKENAFTLPLALLLVEFCFFGIPGRQRLLEMLPVLLTIVIIPLTVLSPSQSGSSLLTEVNNATEAGALLSRSEYLFTQFGVICRYLGLLIIPIGQIFDYYTGYQAVFSLADPRAFIPGMFLLTLAGAAFVLLIKSGETVNDGTSFPHREARLIGFAILWFFVTISVESSILPIADVYFEHRVYLPSVGFFLSIAALVALIWNRWPSLNKIMISVCIIVALLLSGATLARNQLWRDPITMWQDVKQKAPKNPRVWTNLGKEYSLRKMHREAIAEYKTSIELNPRSPSPYNNLGRTYLDLGMVAEALPYFRSSIEKDQEFPLAHHNLGVALMKLGDYSSAVGELQIAVQLRPTEYSFRIPLGGALLMQNRLDEAEIEFREVLRVKPMNNTARAGMQEVMRRRGAAGF